MTGPDLVAGGLVMSSSALVAGASGFGLSLLSTPLLLLAGFPLPFVVTVNLLTSLATRITVAFRFRSHVNHARSALLVAASISGLISVRRRSST